MGPLPPFPIAQPRRFWDERFWAAVLEPPQTEPEDAPNQMGQGPCTTPPTMPSG